LKVMKLSGIHHKSHKEDIGTTKCAFVVPVSFFCAFCG
jgi:hypothetical protein